MGSGVWIDVFWFYAVFPLHIECFEFAMESLILPVTGIKCHI